MFAWLYDGMSGWPPHADTSHDPPPAAHWVSGSQAEVPSRPNTGPQHCTPATLLQHSCITPATLLQARPGSLPSAEIAHSRRRDGFRAIHQIAPEIPLVGLRLKQ